MTSISTSPIVRNWPRLNAPPPPEPAAPPALPAVELSRNPLLEGSGPKHLPVNIYLAKQEYEQRLRAQALEKTQTPEAPAIDTAPTQASTHTQAVESAVLAVTKTPTADPLEIAALELLLADPAIQEIIQHFGGPRELPAGGNPVADSLIERYDALLVSRLNQLQIAQKEVQRLYLEKLGASFANPDVGIPGSIYSFNTGRWEFHLDVFTRMWSQGNRPEQKAWASLYGGSEAVQKHINTAQKALYWTLNGERLHWKYPESDESGRKAGTVQLLNGLLTSITPPHYSAHKLIDHNLVWFDTQKGWVTYAGNFKQDKTEQFFSTVIPLAAAAAGGWAASTAVANAGGNAVLQSMAAGAAASAAGQLAGNGKIDFKTLLTSAFAGGLSTAITEIPAISQHLNAPSNAFSQKLIQHTGKASLQGAIQAVLGGQFKDGAIHSLMASVAGEIGACLRVEISQIKNLSRTEANTLRLLARATESALRIAANPQDKGYAFAQDFLAFILDDVLQNDAAQSDTIETVTDTVVEQGSDIRFDDEVVMERDPYFMDITSMYGKELATQAEKGLELLKAEMERYNHKLIAKEVYFKPDGEGMRYIKIDGVFIGEDKKVIFGEAKMGNSDLTKNQKLGIPMLNEGKGVFYGKEAAKVAKELGIQPDANGRFRIPADKLLGVHIATYGRTIPRPSRMQYRMPFIRGGGGI